MSQLQPTMRVTMDVQPPLISMGEDCTLTITATLDYPTPITLYTRPTIFNLSLAQRLRSFFCIDLSDNNKCIPVDVDTDCRRGGISRQLGGRDDQYFFTFYPAVPISFTERFDVAARSYRPLTPGHRYRFGINRQHLSVSWLWLHGTREDVMNTEPEFLGIEGRSEITILPGDEVEFEMKEQLDVGPDIKR